MFFWSDCSDSISGDNSSFYTKSSSSEENLRYEEPRTSSSPVEKRQSRREESILSSKRSAKKKSAKQKKASFEHSRRRLRGYFQERKLTRSKGLSAQIFLNRLVWSPPKTGITSALRNIYFVNHKIKNELSTADSWILPQVFDVCKWLCLINGQGEQESCHLCDLLWLGWKCWRIFKSERPLKSDCNRTFPGWTEIGVTRLHVFRENALLLHYYFSGFGDWDWR